MGKKIIYLSLSLSIYIYMDFISEKWQNYCNNNSNKKNEFYSPNNSGKGSYYLFFLAKV